MCREIIYMDLMEEKKKEFAYEKSINSAIPIWEALGMSEEEYMKKYGQPFTIQEEEKSDNQHGGQ